LRGELSPPDSERVYTLSAALGETESESHIFDLSAGVILSSDDGYKARTDGMRLNYAEYSLQCNSPVHLEWNGGNLEAARFEVLPGGDTFVFRHGVKIYLTGNEKTINGK